MNKQEIEKFRRKRLRGQSTVELVTGLIIFVPIVLLFIDIALMVMATTTNDSICREAARAAAKVPPVQYTQPGVTPLTYSGDLSQNRAQAVIDAANKSAGSVSNYTLTSVVPDNLAKSFPATLSQQGGVWQGTVTVNTSCEVHPLTVLNVINGGKGIPFNATQNFPYTYVVPQNGNPN